MKKILNKVLCLTLVAISLFSLTSCGKPSKLLDKSEKTIKTANTVVTVTDDGIIAYEYGKKIVLASGSAEVTETEKTIENYELVEKQNTTTVTDFNRSSIISLKVEKKDCKDYKFKKRVLTATVSNAKVAKVLGVENLQASSDMKLTVKFNKKDKVEKITFYFKLANGMDVAVIADYTY